VIETLDKNLRVFHYWNLIKQTAKYYERYKIVEDLTSIDDDILKVTICDFNGSENNSNNYFDEYRDKVQITVSGEIWLDMVAKGINKGVAINEIQNLLNIDYKETMVFGDYLNDLEMMSSAYHSYAMANAHDTLKKAARFIAKSNDENGVIQAIKSVAL
jgi:hydroxymethylpyrimidine pyrophosphatase-like HAD family hydrolase